MSLRKWPLLIGLAIGLLVCATASAKPHSKDKLRVLFIGNSLTYANDLPAIITALAKATRQRPLVYKTLVFPDFSLEDHWNRGDARKEIAKGGWDVVVLQQGPSALPESRVLLREYVRKFGEEIRRAGAKPAIYMVWPSADRQLDFDRMIESHKLAAADVDGILLPVGAAWRAAFKRDHEIALYGSDGFHPSALGSFLAAWIIFEKLYNIFPEMPAKLIVGSALVDRIDLHSSQKALLTQAASEAMRN
jgi:hypothetical protein